MVADDINNGTIIALTQAQAKFPRNLAAIARRLIARRRWLVDSARPSQEPVPDVQPLCCACSAPAEYRYGERPLCDACSWKIAEAGGV